ncbi:DinB family protein [Dyadobacter psychrotolerans]|uniref:DinB family protein n=1 Tax=Dyadobacter psychrotolerans TaxID=2541721 RepID=A0A4R5E203_9BACT|nr:DinB family protein [Dyadobacter psychrotolerans]TDE17983.1 DinB family protein [Dyadobacter psychrotolerans]
METKTKSEILLELWKEARTRFSNQLSILTPQDLSKKLPLTQNSVGFLIQHVGDVELLFAKNVFGSDVKVSAKTFIAQRDTGEWTNLDELIKYVSYSATTLEAIISKQSAEDWETEVITKEFGKKTKAESLGRIISHTAHHGGQLAIILKYAHQEHYAGIAI